MENEKLFFLGIRRPPESTHCPYATLFRTGMLRPVAGQRHPAAGHAGVLKSLDDGAGACAGQLPVGRELRRGDGPVVRVDRKSTRLNSSHANISYAVFCLKKKNHPPLQSFI